MLRRQTKGEAAGLCARCYRRVSQAPLARFELQPAGEDERVGQRFLGQPQACRRIRPDFRHAGRQLDRHPSILLSGPLPLEQSNARIFLISFAVFIRCVSSRRLRHRP